MYSCRFSFSRSLSLSLARSVWTRESGVDVEAHCDGDEILRCLGILRGRARGPRINTKKKKMVEALRDQERREKLHAELAEREERFLSMKNETEADTDTLRPHQRDCSKETTDKETDDEVAREEEQEEAKRAEGEEERDRGKDDMSFFCAFPSTSSSLRKGGGSGRTSVPKELFVRQSSSSSSSPLLGSDGSLQSSLSAPVPGQTLERQKEKEKDGGNAKEEEEEDRGEDGVQGGASRLSSGHRGQQGSCPPPSSLPVRPSFLSGGREEDERDSVLQHGEGHQRRDTSKESFVLNHSPLVKKEMKEQIEALLARDGEDEEDEKEDRCKTGK